MRNFLHSGESLPVSAPSGGVSSGDGVLVGSLFGVAAYSAAAGAPVEIRRRGVYSLPKAGSTTFVPGDKVYWDATAKNCTSTASGNKLIGVATVAAASADPAVAVCLPGMVIA